MTFHKNLGPIPAAQQAHNSEGLLSPGAKEVDVGDIAIQGENLRGMLW